MRSSAPCDETRQPYTGGTMYKELFSKSTLTLEVQTVAFYINSLRWRYKQLLSKSTPMLEVQPYAGGSDATDQSSLFW